jgi:hypothetical protein
MKLELYKYSYNIKVKYWAQERFDDGSINPVKFTVSSVCLDHEIEEALNKNIESLVKKYIDNKYRKVNKNGI